MADQYTANKVKDPGRQRYAVIFRHPVRLDTGGKPGRRVRRGLGTADETEAESLVAQLNVLLGSKEFWTGAARGTAAGRFDARVVSIFFDGMDPASKRPSRALREEVLPLPSAADGYRHVLLLGTTGAGKTTVVRQLLGTDPKKHRFPSTSSSRTTVAETEIVLADGPFRAVVTFAARDEVIDHLSDCASKAALASLRGASDDEVQRRLLDHENQRFRFSYVLGRAKSDVEDLNATNDASAVVDDFADLEDAEETEDEAFDAEPWDLDGVDLAVTAAVIERGIKVLRQVVSQHASEARALLGADGEEDDRIAHEILEEELDRLLRDDERFNTVVDEILDEIEKRFEALMEGNVKRDNQGWPLLWTWTNQDVVPFLRAVNRFTSNYAPMFGHLLTPLVDGIRVSGPFQPTWPTERPRLVLVDGEGLGHTPKTAALLPTEVIERIEEVDAVLLVDHSKQSMQAAPTTAIRSMLTSGNVDKLIFCFTHFEQVTGDNMMSVGDAARHVVNTAESFLAAVRDEFHPRAEKALRRQLEENRVFLSAIHLPLEATDADGRRSIKQFQRLLEAIDRVGAPREVGPSLPVYHRANLTFAISEALAEFHSRWRGTLGLAIHPGYGKEHWTRIKALNRRFAEGTADQYDKLQPASNVRELIKYELYRSLIDPLDWTGETPTDEVAIATINEFANEIARSLEKPIRESLRVRPQAAWQQAFALTGYRSTFERARRIGDEVFARYLPVPGRSPSVDKNAFLDLVLGAIEEAARKIGVELR